MLVDSHCHLDFPQFEAERDLIVKRANDAGVGRMVTICTRVKKFDEIHAIAQNYECVYCSVGTHPHNALEEEDVSLEQLLELAERDKVVAIGEAGLDYFYDNAPRDVQEKVLRTHIAAARQTQLPLVIHSRDADADMARILREEMAIGAFPALLHCFSSSLELAREALELGLYVSFSGILTFKRSTELREIATQIPLDRLLVETDAPYLAPQPWRGKTNEPAYVTHTNKVLAEVHGISEAEMARTTTENFLRLFTRVGTYEQAKG
ncbi:TatD family hydrolase [Polycladidibacter stylochi]|uniref:TatD family hydrolase n=1 Tax=Polycladidibacter stylochi TaxID=1807766 RepID=UPI00082D3D32|nr:TatD family hydrolase [Pseudovibrio stylochi]